MKNYSNLIGVILIASIAQFATDIYLPSLPAISEFFGYPINAGQLTIAIYMAALTVTQLFWGPLSDLIGRKKALSAGISLGIIGSLVCATAGSMNILLVGRAIQGLGFGAAAGLWRAILRDIYTGAELSSIAAYLGNLLVMVLMVAPVLGGFFQRYYSWHASFYFLLALATVILLVMRLFVAETGHTNKKTPSNWKQAYKRLLGSRVFMGCCLSNFITYGGMFAWITSSSVVLIEEAGMSPLSFGFWSGVSGLGIMVGSTINGRYVKKIGIDHMLYSGWSVIVIAGLVLTIGTLVLGPTAPLVLISAFLFYFGSAFVFANTNATAFASFGDIAGTAAGLYAFIQLSGGAFTSYLLANILETGSLWLGILFIIAGAGAWLNYSLLVKRHRV